MMPGDTRRILHARLTDPAFIVIGSLVLLFAVVIAFAFRFTTLIASALPVAVFASCLVLLLVPQKNFSPYLLLALGASVPFAHFAVIVLIGEGIQWAHVFGFLLITHLVIRILLGNRIPLAPATPWVFALVLASLVSSIAFIGHGGEQTLEFFKSEIQLLFGVFLFLAVTHVKLDERRILLVLRTMITVSVGVALFGIYQLPARFLGLPGGVLRLTNPSLSGSTQTTNILHNLTRASSIFSEPSFFGHYMVGMIVITLIAALHRPKLLGPRALIWAVLIIQTAGLILSFSMGSYFMLAALLLLMLIVERGTVKHKLAAIILSVIGIGALALIMVELISGYPMAEQLQARVIGIIKYFQGDMGYLVEGESLFQRLDTSRVGLRVWLDHPLTGVGLGSYTLVSYTYGEWNPFGFAANSAVNLLAETGILGFLCFVAIGIASVGPLYGIFRRKIRNGFEPENHEDLALIARMMFYLVIAELSYFFIMSILFWPGPWFYLGLGGAVAILARRRKRESSLAKTSV